MLHICYAVIYLSCSALSLICCHHVSHRIALNAAGKVFRSRYETTQTISGTPKKGKVLQATSDRLNNIVNQSWFLFTETTPVNDGHTHVHPHTAVFLHPLFFYCLKLVKPAPQSPCFRRQTQRMLRYFS